MTFPKMQLFWICSHNETKQDTYFYIDVNCKVCIHLMYFYIFILQNTEALKSSSVSLTRVHMVSWATIAVQGWGTRFVTGHLISGQGVNGSWQLPSSVIRLACSFFDVDLSDSLDIAVCLGKIQSLGQVSSTEPSSKHLISFKKDGFNFSEYPDW